MNLLNFWSKLKAKGFTLIELIATIALLAIIALISFVSVTAVINKNKEKQYKNLVSSIEIAAKQYASDNKYSDSFANRNTVTISLSDLSNYIKLPVIDPYTNEEITDVSIVIHLENGNVKDIELNGMPVHENVINNPDLEPQGEVVDNDDTGNNTDTNNEENNNVQTYRMTLSCESPSTSDYGGCRFANDIANYTVTLNLEPGATVDLNADTCYCGKAYYIQSAWLYAEGNQVLGFESFTMPEHDVTLYALYNN